MKDDVFTIRDRQALEHNEYLILSPFAAKSREWSQTRMYCEDEHAYRTAFQRDRDRIIHSRAFRRLKHKRQVFLITYGDHYRTRLTHTLEVSQLSRTIARTLGLNEDLAEAIALGHDLGHTPFGHVGEVVLHRIMNGEDDLDGAMLVSQSGGFKHNYQSLRIVDVNEKKYERPGLNLTAAVREGILKHTRLRRNELRYPDFQADLLNYKLDDAVTLEGQIVAICDEIAQRTHDLEDGIRAGYVSMRDVRNVAVIRKMEKETGKSLETENGFMFRNQLIRYLVDFLVSDVIQSTQNRLQRFYELAKRQQFYDTRIVWFSDDLNPLQEDLDRFIMKNIIGLAVEQRRDTEAVKIIRSLFKYYYLYPNQLPTYRLEQCADGDVIAEIFNKPSDARFATIQWLQTEPPFARAICDHIAGMTDHFADREMRRLSQLPAAELQMPAHHQAVEL